MSGGTIRVSLHWFSTQQRNGSSTTEEPTTKMTGAYPLRNMLRREAARAALRFARWCNPEAETNPVSYGDVALRDAYRGGWFRAESRELFEGFAIARSDTVIDVGCGTGENAAFCAPFAARMILVDADPKKIAATEQRLRSSGATNWRTILSNGNPLPIDAGTGDKIVCTEVLEHVPDPDKFMQELVRVGKSGALYLISVPDSLSERVAKQVAPSECFREPNHIRSVGRDELEQLATNAGLQIEKHAFYGFYWAVWHALVWKCNIDFDHGHHPALDHWTRAWNAVLDLPEGQACKNALDEAMPKSQIIVARKN
jgi:2-polyprenyl-3-methyl-5-hydroxy-6-metoxy-1,4-benzoquinol methylase